MKGTFSNSKRGFTLVELVVVIAIIAILSGVGFAAYTGYVEYAQKGVDRQTVGEIIHALELADYADPGLFGEEPQGIAFLTSNGVFGSSSAVKKAIEDAGLETSTLSYDKWDSSNALDAVQTAVTALQSLSFFDEPGIDISYIGSAKKSWDAVKDATNKMVDLLNSGGFGLAGGEAEKMGPALVLAAAKTAQSAGDNFKWSDFTPSSSNTESIPAIVARNYAFAEYLRNNCNYDGIEEDISKLQDALGTANAFITGEYTDPLKDPSFGDEFKNAANAYLTATLTDGLTQADVDYEAYKKMMESINTTYGSKLEERIEDGKKYYSFTGDAGSFWDEAGSYISTAGQVAQMSQAERDELLEDLAGISGNSVYIEVIGRKPDGSLDIAPNPSDVDPRSEASGSGGCSHEHTTGTVTLEYSRKISITSPSNNIVLCNTAGATSIQFNINNHGSGEIQSFNVLTDDDTLTWTWEGNEDNIVSLSKDGTLTASKVTETKTVTLIITVKKIPELLRIDITIYP